MNRNDLQLYNLQRVCHAIAKQNGFYDNVTSPSARRFHIYQQLTHAMIELGELADLVRKRGGLNVPNFAHESWADWENDDAALALNEALAEEVADVIIILLDWAEFVGLDISNAMVDKLAKNSTRGRQYGVS